MACGLNILYRPCHGRPRQLIARARPPCPADIKAALLRMWCTSHQEGRRNHSRRPEAKQLPRLSETRLEGWIGLRPQQQQCQPCILKSMQHAAMQLIQPLVIPRPASKLPSANDSLEFGSKTGPLVTPHVKRTFTTYGSRPGCKPQPLAQTHCSGTMSGLLFSARRQRGRMQHRVSHHSVVTRWRLSPSCGSRLLAGYNA